ncbi:hypothetical protein [Stratiformator vulcanicus]|uniref:Uncharacterized protein n=1 Tax=Stratiformator vulcanicus TaxID=2527980 RepID=A0A517QYA5_9PLAN|nr:hypothetical protein [Stratiformator vulcanicus]QDT36540.1 hypothetical protein Pan189_09000 [Stratiformator vulcanicus]
MAEERTNEEILNDVAKEVHESDRFRFRACLDDVDEVDGLLAIVNNNPVEADRVDDSYGTKGPRGKAHAAFVEACEGEGVACFGVGSYPPVGEEDAGYTVAIGLTVEKDDDATMSRVCDLYEQHTGIKVGLEAAPDPYAAHA